MEYSRIDMKQWHRAARFRFRMDELRVVMSLKVDVDVTPLLSFVRRSGLRFYPVMLWVVSKVVNAHDEFRLGWDQEDRLIQWRTVSPSYSDFHPEDEGVVKSMPHTPTSFRHFTGRSRQTGKNTDTVSWLRMRRCRISSMCPVCPG